MPRLTDYLAREVAAPPSPPQAAPAAAPTAPAPAAAPDEAARLRRQHEHRLAHHGPRVYRHADGRLSPTPPPRQPFTVGNRRQWHGLRLHCVQQAGVAQHGGGALAARYGDAPHEQHVVALAAIGLEPEVDAAGEWQGHVPALQDPLGPHVAQQHALAAPEWRSLTKDVLRQAQAVHGGASVLARDGWQHLWEAVNGGGV